MSLAVVYLARGIGAGKEAALAFFNSYAAHPAGVEHDLVILKKGWEGVSHSAEIDALAARHNARVLELPDDGFDWGAYMRAAAMLHHERVVFMNSFSRIEAPSWLRHMSDAMARPGVGSVGATGSWGTARPMLFMHMAIAKRVASTSILRGLYVVCGSLAKVALLTAVRARRFPPFPNPHLRSTSFMVRRSEFLEFTRVSKMPTNKFDAYALESGYESFTKWVTARGNAVIVVGRNGGNYEVEEWLHAGTLFVPAQPNLLVSDNRTRDFDNGDERAQWGMTLFAWGLTTPPQFHEQPLHKKLRR